MEELFVLFALQMVGSLINNATTRGNVEHAAGVNYGYGEQAADNAASRQTQLYNSLYSAPAQVQYLKEAGLSPGLMYANGAGGSGQTFTPQGTGAGAQQGKMFDLYGNNEMLRTMSEIELNKAQARKLNADADVTENTGINLANANISKLLADTGLTLSKTTTQNLQNSYDEIRNEIYAETKDFHIRIVEKSAEKYANECELLAEDIKGQKLTNEFNTQTLKDRVEQIQLQNQNLIKDLLLKGSQIKLNDEQVKYLQETITQKWLSVATEFGKGMSEIELNKAKKEWFEAETKATLEMLPINKGVKIANSVINGVAAIAKAGASVANAVVAVAAM